MCISIVERVYSCRFVSIYNCLAILADVCSFGSLIGRFFFCIYCYPCDATHDCLPFVCIFFCFSVLFCFFFTFFFWSKKVSDYPVTCFFHRHDALFSLFIVYSNALIRLPQIPSFLLFSLLFFLKVVLTVLSENRKKKSLTFVF